MRPKIRNIVLEPKRFFGDLWHTISWPKVIAFVLIVVFFVNVGIFIHNKKNPVEVDPIAFDTVQSPYTEETHEDHSPSEMFGTTHLEGRGDGLSAPLDAEGVFEKKTNSDEGNLPPIAKIEMITTDFQEAIYVGDTVFLSAEKSYDPDGMILTYRWDFDDSNGLGIDAEGLNTTAKYNSPGVYTVTLMVIDDNGVEATTTMSINVAEQKEEQPNDVVQGLTTSLIDFDSLNFMSRTQVQNAIESSYADFTAETYSVLAQSIYNSQKKSIPTLPSISDIDLHVGPEPSSQPPVVDSFIPKKGSKIFEQRPAISVGFYGNNKINIDGIEMMVDGKPVTQDVMKTAYGVQYRPSEDLGFGQHSVMVVVPDEKGLKTVQSWDFEIIDRHAEYADLVEEYVDEEGPEIILHYPDRNARNVKTDSDIIVKYNEPVNPNTVEVAVVDLSTNVTKFFTKDQIQFDSTNTGFTIRANENIFDFDRSYQIVARQEDKLGNRSSFAWYVMGEEYGAPKFEITSPEPNTVFNRPEVTITGFTDPTYQIFVNDIVATVDSNGGWKADISLERDKNEILITAKNLLGRESSQYLVLYYDPNANDGNPILDTQDSPVIMDASIRDGQTISKIRPQISFVYADTDGIDRESIRLIVNGEDVTKYSFIADDSITYKPLEPLKQGEQKVQLIVSDKKGNTTDYEMVFYVDAYPEQPTALTASLTNNNENVLLVWDGVTNISNPEYRVFRSTQPNVKTTAANEIARGLTDTSFVDTDVIDGTKYFYVVTAVTKDGNLSDPSNEVEITVDFTPPPLLIMEPEKNFETEEDNVTIKGSTEEGAEVEVYVNFQLVGTPTLNTDGTFEINVDLIEGENIITIISRDADGNESIDIRTVTYIPPDLEAPRPVDKSPEGTQVPIDSDIVVTYNEEINPETISLTLKRVDDPDNPIPVNMTDIALQVSKDGKTITYNPRFDLDYEARYRVEIYVEDLAGNESVGDDWEFETEDKDPPPLEIISPKQGFLVDKTDIFVTGKTEPNVHLLIRVTTSGGETYDFIEEEYELTSQFDGTFKQLVELHAHKENVITVIATDELGHSSMVVIEGESFPPITDKPLLKVTSPNSNAVVGDNEISVTGKTQGDARITINVNGEMQHDFEMDGDTDFSKKVRLNGGQNLITVIATDPFGNQEQISVIVFYDNIPPLLDVANPIDGLTTNQGRVELRGMTEREGVLVTVSVNGDESNVSILPDGTFNKWINLKVGNNYIVVRAEDAVGNVTTVIRNAYHDPVKGIAGSSDEVSGASADGDSGIEPIEESNEEDEGVESSSNEEGGIVIPQSTNDTIDPSTGEMRFTGGEDNEAPAFIDLTPRNGYETNEPELTIRGETEPEAKVVVFQNGINVFEGKSRVDNGRFSATVTLVEGQNKFIITSQDASGNRRQEMFIMTLDTEGPATSVLAPKVDELINERNIDVYGLTEAHTDVRIQLGTSTQRVTSDEFGYYSATVRASSEGNQNIIVEATDKLGNKTTKVVPIVVDLTAPDLTLQRINGQAFDGQPSTAPNGGLVYIDSTVGLIEGRTEEGTTVDIIVDGAIKGSTTADSRGNFRVQAGFSSGRVSYVEVRATDEAGNIRSRYFRVGADKEPPIVTIYRPNATVNNNGHNSAIVNGNQVRVSGVVEDDNMPVTIQFGLNEVRNAGSTTVSSSSGYFSEVIGPLRKGTNIIHITATDRMGNSNYQTATVAYREGGIDWLGSVNTNISASDADEFFRFGYNVTLARNAAGGKGDYGKFGSRPSPNLSIMPGEFANAELDNGRIRQIQNAYANRQLIDNAIGDLISKNPPEGFGQNLLTDSLGNLLPNITNAAGAIINSIAGVMGDMWSSVIDRITGSLGGGD